MIKGSIFFLHRTIKVYVIFSLTRMVQPWQHHREHIILKSQPRVTPSQSVSDGVNYIYSRLMTMLVNLSKCTGICIYKSRCFVIFFQTLSTTSPSKSTLLCPGCVIRQRARMLLIWPSVQVCMHFVYIHICDTYHYLIQVYANRYI